MTNRIFQAVCAATELKFLERVSEISWLVTALRVHVCMQAHAFKCTKLPVCGQSKF